MKNAFSFFVLFNSFLREYFFSFFLNVFIVMKHKDSLKNLLPFKASINNIILCYAEIIKN